MGTIHRSKVIQTAKDWIGYEEGENNWTIFSKILDDCDYYAPQKKQGQPWCHNFINAIFLISAEPRDRDDDEKKYDAQNYLCQPSYDNLSCGCTYGADYFRNADRFRPVTEADIGDIIYFGKRGEESHVGLIIDVDRDDDGDITRVYTIEGNKGDKVDTGSYSVNYSRISGIGKPQFDDYYDSLDEEPETSKPEPDPEKPEPAPEPEKPTAPEKTIDELASEVINGVWGNGKERAELLTAAGYDYQAVQDKVNELLGISKPATSSGKIYTVSVNTKLNVRYGAGMDYPIKYQLSNGDKVTVYEKEDGWGRIGDDEWVCMKYLK